MSTLDPSKQFQFKSAPFFITQQKPNNPNQTNFLNNPPSKANLKRLTPDKSTQRKLIFYP